MTLNSPPQPARSVCIVDDDAQVRRFLVEVFSSLGLGVQAFTSGDEFMRQWRSDGPTCVLLDIRMPHVTGPEVHDWLRSRHPQTVIIYLTAHADVTTAVRAMRLGAFDFLEKPFNVQHLIERTHEALHQAERQAARPSAALISDAVANLKELTPREREVLKRLVAGRRNKTVAAELGISERTIETHRASIMQKTGTHSIAELVALSLSAGPGTRD